MFGGASSSDGTSSTSQSQQGSGILEQVLGALSSAGQSQPYQAGPAKPQASYSSVDTNVTEGSRAKYIAPIANGEPVTLMVYMCGTDLESRSGMASSDLAEMAAAKFSDNINLIVYTGGCSKWQTQGISSSTNQIYKIEQGGLKRLVKDVGNKAMTSPATLSSFIKWTAKNYPAKRNFLIFWDHGGGSVTGYGYDEKFPKSSSMTLDGIKEALEDGKVKFDFVGFDACLMATAETALMLNPYADYMIASEETEPGIGWYYTNWLTELGNDSSLSTLKIGKKISDDFVEMCAQRCRGQKTTLSLVDLAEFHSQVPERLAAFSKSVSKSLSEKKYKEISDARYNSREFASSSKIDQIDLVDLCKT